MYMYCMCYTNVKHLSVDWCLSFQESDDMTEDNRDRYSVVISNEPDWRMKEKPDNLKSLENIWLADM